MTSAGLFKWTVALLAIPSVLLLTFAVLFLFPAIRGSENSGIGAIAGGLSTFGVALFVSAALGFVIALFAIGRRLIRRG